MRRGSRAATAVCERQTVSPRIHSRSAAGVIACAVAGLGVASGSMWMCADALASGEAVEVLTDYALDPVTAYIVFPAGRRPSQKARAFSDYLERTLAPLEETAPPGASKRAGPADRRLTRCGRRRRSR